MGDPEPGGPCLDLTEEVRGLCEVDPDHGYTKNADTLHAAKATRIRHMVALLFTGFSLKRNRPISN